MRKNCSLLSGAITHSRDPKVSAMQYASGTPGEESQLQRHGSERLAYRHTASHAPTPYLTLLYAVVICSFVVGLALRGASFVWNSRIHGDVNLFALSAREFATHGRLFYPMKYEWSDHVAYITLASPASQHPPLFPFLAGVLATVLRTDNTFLMLKLLSMASGVALLALLAWWGLRSAWRTELLLAAVLAGLSPLIVDFSANGSSYILSTVLMVLLAIVLARFRYERASDYALAGGICGAGLLVHSTMICLAATLFVLGLARWRHVTLLGILTYSAVFLAVLSPWLAWNVYHFGKPLYSYSTYHLLGLLGLTEMGIFGDVVAVRITRSASSETVRRYLSLFGTTSLRYLIFYLLQIGPFAWFFAIVGSFALITHAPRMAIAVLLPTLLYILVIFGWVTFDTRFLVPILPFTYIAIAFGFTDLMRRSRPFRLASVACLPLTFGWSAIGFMEHPPTKYYMNDAGHAEGYAQMVPLAQELSTREPGVMLGYSTSLDGGIEAVYWHRFPFVHGRGFDGNVLRKLVDDFQVRYIWAEETTLGTVATYVPHARVILQSKPYYVLEILAP